MSKKTIIILGSSIIGILVLLLLIVWLITVFKPRYYSYEKVEEKIIQASDDYFKKNPESIPANDGKYNLSYASLEQNGYIKPLNELLKDGDSCNAEILVIKNGNNLNFIPRLTCGENYQTKELYKQILSDNQVVTTGSGLYHANDTYFFRGKVENNYVALGSTTKRKETIDNLWQIISIESDNTIRIKSLTRFENKSSYDTRYNETKSNNVGYNDFKNSVFKDYLLKMQDDETFLTATEKSKLVAKKLCAGFRKEDDTSKTGASECSVKTDEAMLYGTMLPYEYIRASLDQNCKNVLDRSCANFNYLANTDISSEWSTIADPVNDYYAYAFSGTGYSASTAKNLKNVYPTVYLNEYALYKSGTGTKDDPYRLFKKESTTTKKSTN